jgi:hypothetical protein
MNTETQAPRSRQHSWLLILLGVLVVALIITRSWSQFSADGPARPSNQARTAQPAQAEDEAIDPKTLEVRLETLEGPRPEKGRAERDPFRFKPVAPPPPPATRQPMPTGPVGPPPPPPVPPIPLKLMGFVELPSGLKLANLSDCKGATWSVREGENVDGQYRVVKIGLESIVIEYVSGKGRQTMRVDGCPPR